MAISNCTRCRKIFQKVASSLCPDCIRMEEEHFTVLYRTLQESASSGGITIDALAAEVGIPAEQIEKLYLDGRLSTAAAFLKIQCQACGSQTSVGERKGRYCQKCSETTASKAGVELKTFQEIKKVEAQEQFRQEQLSLLKRKDLTSSKSTDKNARKFGVSYRSR